MIIYLYVKQHSITGLKYFGKTERSNPFKYPGSGSYWKRHIKKHGKEYVKTIELWSFDDQDLCTEFALKFSEENDIVESDVWANLRYEDGLNGGARNLSTVSRLKISEENTGRFKGKTYEEIYGIDKAKELRKSRGESNTKTKKGIAMSAEQKQKRRHPYGKRSDEFKNKCREVAKNRPKPLGKCNHCGKEGVLRALKRWHFGNCKYNK